MLCPIQGGKFSAKLVNLLWNAERAGELNWGAYVLKHLVECASKKKPVREPKGKKLVRQAEGSSGSLRGMGGCVLFLMVIQFECIIS